jgi:hypothetical protein
MSNEARARARRLAAGWERRFYSELWVDEIEAALTAARAEGEAAGRAQGHEEAAEAIDGELCPRCDTDIALSTWARVFREKAAAIRARKEG